MRVLDLQRALPCTRASAEDLEDDAGTVQHLCVPGAFQVALLHRRERTIEDDKAGGLALDQAGDLLDLALADEGRGRDRAQGNDSGLRHLQIDRSYETDRL